MFAFFAKLEASPPSLPFVRMPDTVFIRRPSPRSFAQIAMDQTLRDEDAYTTIAHDLQNTRRVARLLAPEVAKFRLGVDLTQLSNLRVTNNKAVLFVQTAAQHARLRQILPRLTRILEQAGLVLPIEIRIRPVKTTISLRDNLAQGQPRVASAQTQRTVMQAAQSLENSPLKQALLSLARTMEHTAGK